MLGENHDLFHELPEYQEQIKVLRTNDDHFAELFDDYHRVNREVERIEAGLETPSDFYTEDLKKQRLHLKDQLYTLLRSVEA
ncbi:MAG: DUF465 domain-containing protein [Candidatus Competibacteraceae bacterium]|jgi:uncharacterized protein YdcH (DUF465 family)|nr:DUF465 domain-containing protein [Candidatus Competibacteraceae bacterium]